MPELPEVETVRRGVSRLATGAVIESVRLLREDIAHGIGRPSDALLRGRRIEGVTRRGKQIQIDLTGGWAMIVHLGMTGRLAVIAANQPLATHTHFRMSFQGREDELRFCDPRRFGGIWLIQPLKTPAQVWIGRPLPRTAQDPLVVSLATWRRLLARRRQIKALLLDQDPISGVGNIYADEALHRARIHPTSRASELRPEAVGRLYRALRRVLNEAVAAGGSSVSDYRDAEGLPGWFQTKHRVYGRGGQPCRRCGTTIEKIRVAGRGTHLCPRCQPIGREVRKGRSSARPSG